MIAIRLVLLVLSVAVMATLPRAVEVATLQQLDRALASLDDNISIRIKTRFAEQANECDFDAMVHWFRAHGGIIHPNISLVTRSNGYRQVEANGTVEAGAVVMALPKVLVFDSTTENLGDGRRPGFSNNGWDELPEIPLELQQHTTFEPGEYLEITRLATRLLSERLRGGSSFFAPYINCLPRGCTGLVCASDATLRLLDSDLGSDPPKRTFMAIYRNRPGPWPFDPAPSAKQWLESVGLVLSRRWDGLYPLADMLDHDPDGTPMVYKQETGRHERVQAVELARGDALVHSYDNREKGHQTCFKMLSSYGFAPRDAVHQHEMIQGTLPCEAVHRVGPVPPRVTRAESEQAAIGGCQYMQDTVLQLQSLDPTHVKFVGFVPPGAAVAAATARGVTVRFSMRAGGGMVPAVRAMLRAFVHSHPGLAGVFAGGTGLGASHPALQALLQAQTKDEGDEGEGEGEGEGAGGGGESEADRVVGAIMREAVRGRFAEATRCRCDGAVGTWEPPPPAEEAEAEGAAGEGGCPLLRPVLEYNNFRCAMLCHNCPGCQ